MPRALITGISGQDGSYLAEFLLEKGYEVFGVVRKVKPDEMPNIRHILDKVTLIEGDLADQSSLNRAVKTAQPDEVYNLAAQTFVGLSWKQADYTANITGLGCLRMLEAVRNYSDSVKFLQASSSEMFGVPAEIPTKETTVLKPISPYACAKVFAHNTTIGYRQSYDIFACCSICFNHESERRGLEFATRKISNGVAKIKLGLAKEIGLGNLDPKRDWGYAPDFVRAMWMMLQQKKPNEYIVATNECHSVKEFIEEAFKYAGIDDWQKHIVVDQRFIRPTEIYEMRGDNTKAKNELGWEPTVKFKELVQRMVKYDIERLGGKI